jgi:hypothetical protein
MEKGISPYVNDPLPSENIIQGEKEIPLIRKFSSFVS